MESAKGWLAESGASGGHFPFMCPPLCRYNACLGSFADVYGDLPSTPAPDISIVPTISLGLPPLGDTIYLKYAPKSLGAQIDH